MWLCLIPIDCETMIQDTPGGNPLETLSVSLQILCFPIVAMEIRKPSLAGASSWPWTGSGEEDTPTSKCSSRPGGKNHQEPIPLLEVSGADTCSRSASHPCSAVS